MSRIISPIAVVLFVLTGAAASAQVWSGRTFADFPDTPIEYYEVSGNSANAIRAQMAAIRPSDPKTGRRHDAWTSWRFRLGGRQRPGEACEGRVELTTSVQFPRLAADARLSKRDRAAWDRFVTALEAHEAGHLALAHKAAADAKAALDGGECAATRVAAQAVLDAASQAQVAFDKETAHGQRTGVAFP